MITISKINEEYFFIKFGFSEQYFNRVRRIPNSYYDNELKGFFLPLSQYKEFKELFYGEYVFKTSKYDFPGEVMEDYTNKYELKKQYNLPSLKFNPYKYQAYGINYMLNKLEDKGYVLNSDGVGLGKTISAIGTALYLIQNNKVKKILILCKKSLRHQWKNEIEKFTDYNLDKVLVVNGTPAQKKKIYEQFLDFDDGILISNYDVVVSKMDTDMLNKMSVELLVVDEIHTIKGHSTKKNKEISKISQKIKYKIFLTGTPMASKPDDLFGVMKIADNKYFGTKKDFDSKYLTFENTKFGYKSVGYKNLYLLESSLHDIMISRSEKEVELDLPEMLPTNRIEFDMDKTQSKIQDFIDSEKNQLVAISNSLKDKIDELKYTPGSEREIQDLEFKIKSMSDTMKGLQAFYQVNANDPNIFNYSKSSSVIEKYGQFIKDSYEFSPKTEMLLSIIEDILSSNQKVIIFSMYERSVAYLKDTIEKELKVNVLEYTGAVNSEDREKNVKLFNTNEDYNVIVMTSAGQEGLTTKFSPNSLNCGKLLRA